MQKKLLSRSRDYEIELGGKIVRVRAKVSSAISDGREIPLVEITSLHPFPDQPERAKIFRAIAYRYFKTGHPETTAEDPGNVVNGRGDWGTSRRSCVQKPRGTVWRGACPPLKAYGKLTP